MYLSGPDQWLHVTEIFGILNFAQGAHRKDMGLLQVAFLQSDDLMAQLSLKSEEVICPVTIGQVIQDKLA